MTSARQSFIDAQQRFLDRYAVAAQSLFVDVPSLGGKAHVLVSGEGAAVIMLNGIGTPGAMWAPLMAELKEFQLFVVDLPGYGLTDAPRQFVKELCSSAIRFLEEVLVALDLPSAPFIANSLGSLYASWLALERPNRVKALVHVGTPAIVLDTSAPFPMRLLSVRPLGRVLTWLQPPSSSQVEQLSKMVKEYPLVEELVDLLVATERLPGYREMFLAMLHKLLRLRGNQPRMRLKAWQLAMIAQPTLLFWGRDDPFGSTEVGARMVATMPAAEMRVVGGGHTPWLTEAERIAPIARWFLRRHG